MLADGAWGASMTEEPRIADPAHRADLPGEDDLTPERRVGYEALRALAREAAKHKLPGATSDHSDMYDDNGLPI